MPSFAKRIAPVVRSLALSLLATASAGAASPPWTPLGPFGGIVLALTADATHSGTLYATTSGGLFKTTDGGGSWASIYRQAPSSNVVVDPAHPATLYVGTNDLAARAVVIKSTDGGAHWLPAGGGLPRDPNQLPQLLAIDPARTNRLYLSFGQGIWRSGDGAASWQPANDGLPSGRFTPVWALAAVARPAGTAFVATSNGVFRTTDGGSSWKPSQGLPAAEADALAASPSEPRTVYADFTRLGLYRTTNGGFSWQRAGAAPSRDPLLALAASRSPGELYAAVEGGPLLRSMNGGASWVPAGPPGQPSRALAVDPAAGTVYVGAYASPVSLGGVFRSDDAGATWVRRNRGMSGLAARAAAVDPADPDRLWASLGSLLFESANRGAGWARVEVASEPGFHGFVDSLGFGPASQLFAVTALYSSPSNGAQSDLGLWRTDGAGTAPVGWSLSRRVQGPGALFRAAPSDLSTLYLQDVQGLTALDFQRSTDGGATWQVLSKSLLDCGIGDLAVAPSNAAVVYLAGSAPGSAPGIFPCKPPVSARVLRSEDGGVSWTDVSAGVPREIASAVAVDPRDPHVVYVGTGHVYAFPGDGVWKSTDGGASWLRAGGELKDQTITALLASALPGRVYAGTGDGRVFRSDDGGASWQPWNAGLAVTGVSALIADPADPNRLYAVTSNGVWTLTEKD